MKNLQNIQARSAINSARRGSAGKQIGSPDGGGMTGVTPFRGRGNRRIDRLSLVSTKAVLKLTICHRSRVRGGLLVGDMIPS